MGGTWRGVETSTRTARTDQGETVAPPPQGLHLASYLDTYLVEGVSALEFKDEAWVLDVPSRDPAPLLRAITLPVNQVLESPALRSNLQKTSHPIHRLAVDEMGERGGPGKRRQRAVRHGFTSRHMTSRKYVECTGQ